MYRQPSRYTLQNSTPKRAGQNSESICQEVVYFEIPAFTSSKYKAVEMLLCKTSEDASQSHLGIKCQYQYNKVVRLLQHSSAGDWGYNVRGPGDYHSLSLTSIQFHPPKVTPLTNLAEVTAQGLCNSISYSWR